MDELSTATVSALIGVVGAILGAVIARWIERRRASDKEAFAFWRVAFDRPAFKGLYTWQSDQEAFKRAIEDTIKAVTTGVLTDRHGTELGRCKAKAYLKRSEWLSTMDTIESRLNRIRKLIPSEIGEVDLKVTEEMDKERDEILKSLNEIWKLLKIPLLPKPTDVKSYEDVINI
jgi:hypothetical protein